MTLGKLRKQIRHVSFVLLLYGVVLIIVYESNCLDSWIKLVFSTGNIPVHDEIARESNYNQGENGTITSYTGYFVRNFYRDLGLNESDSFKPDAFKNALLSRQQGSFQKRKLTVCGDKWQERYRKLHRDVLQARRPRRFLVYYCGGRGYGCGGYGNRLSAVASLFLLAVLTDRAFLIDWSSGISMDMFWKPKNINWNLPLSNLRELGSRRHYWGKGTPKHVRNDVIRPALTFDSIAKWSLEEDIPNYLNSSVEIVTSVWYLVDMFLRNPSLSEKASQLGTSLPHLKYSFLGCAFDFLFQKTPTLEELLTEAKMSLGLSRNVPFIGLHVRIGDVAFGFKGRATNNFQMFFECAKQAEKRVLEAIHGVKSDGIKWFLATDDASVKSYASKEYPGKVVTLDITPQHIDKYGNHPATSQGMLGVLLDHLILSECTISVLSKSTFGLTAQALEFHSPATYTYGEKCIF